MNAHANLPHVTSMIPAARGPKGLALLIGLKAVDPVAYNGWSGTNGTTGSELDVDNMNRLLAVEGYQATVLKTSQATAGNVLQALRQAAAALKPGDSFVLYASCHGGQVRDTDGDEIDGLDETLVLYDRQLIDDEFATIWPLFAGVRITMITDCCHSETNERSVSVQRRMPEQPKTTLAAYQLIHLSGCRDNGTSAGLDNGGAFTLALVALWNNGTFSGTTQDLLNRIRPKVAAYQDPTYRETGVLPLFRAQRPFAIASAPSKDTPTQRICLAVDIEAIGRSQIEAKDRLLTQIHHAAYRTKKALSRGCSVSISVGTGGVSGSVTCRMLDAVREARPCEVSISAGSSGGSIQVTCRSMDNCQQLVSAKLVVEADTVHDALVALNTEIAERLQAIPEKPSVTVPPIEPSADASVTIGIQLAVNAPSLDEGLAGVIKYLEQRRESLREGRPCQGSVTAGSNGSISGSISCTF